MHCITYRSNILLHSSNFCFSGDELVPVVLPGGSISQSAQETIEWYKEWVNDPQQTSFVVYRYEFMDRPGAIAEKKALYERIVSGLLRVTKIEKTSIGTFQGRDQEGVGVTSASCCAIIATLSCLTHIQPSEGSNGVETREIKEIVDNIAGKLAPLIRRSKESNESHRDNDDANPSADSDNLGVFDVTQFLRGCLVMDDLCAPTPRGGNIFILISDYRSEAILSPLKSGSGNLGMGKNMSACLYVVCIYVLC